MATYKRKIRAFILNKLASMNLLLFPIRSAEGKCLLNNITSHKRGGNIYQTHHQAYALICALKATSKVEGDLAEIGVYKGGSSKLMLEYTDRNKTFHLFDTFQGLPSPKKEDDQRFYEGEYSAGQSEVAKYIGDLTNIEFHAGLFPETAIGLEHYTFSFVHIDVDLVEATVECLKFFYPRMNSGGIFVSQDYAFDAVKQAIDKFFIDKPESVIELHYSQCIIVKM